MSFNINFYAILASSIGLLTVMKSFQSVKSFVSIQKPSQIETGRFYSHHSRLGKIIIPFRNQNLLWRLYDLYSSDVSLSNFATRSSVETQCEENTLCLAQSLPIYVYIDSDIRKFLGMHTKKHRFYLPQTVDKNMSIAYLRSFIVEKQFPALTGKSYALRYLIPGIQSDSKSFRSDEDLQQILMMAADKAPSLLLYVEPVPGIFPPSYLKHLQSMADPGDTGSYTMLSFYRFANIDDPNGFATILQNLWKPFKAVGRVYVATEGINAQMSVPTNVIENFKAACESLPIFRDLYLNTDHTIPLAAFLSDKPFKSLHVRVRSQIVADGFGSDAAIRGEAGSSTLLGSESTFAFDWEKAGREMPPREWHNALDDGNAIILDCRNTFESDVGVFKNAIPLNTTLFRDSWDVLDEVLAGKKKDVPIMTYCTGGIRCVKINAYIEQRLGFTNVNRLQGGIIAYTRELESDLGQNQKDDKYDQAHLERNVVNSKFKGINYVFDERIGARITDDVLAQCETCGVSCDSFLNCENVHCHVRFIQCPGCRSSYNQCCSMYCRQQHQVWMDQLAAKGGIPILTTKTNRQEQSKSGDRSTSTATPRQKKMTPRDTGAKKSRVIEVNDVHGSTLTSSQSTSSTIQDHASSIDSSTEAINGYCEKYSSKELDVLRLLREETLASYNEGAARMISSPLQGTLLTLLAASSKASSVLELGTFTGYATLALAEGISRQPNNPKVITCEIDSNAADIAQRYFDQSGLGHLISLHRMKAAEMIALARQRGFTFDMVFIDADKKMYRDYLFDLMGLAGNKVPLLAAGALIIVDNTLWKGLVLEMDDKFKTQSPDPALFGNADRMRSLAATMHEFNAAVYDLSDHLDVAMLPLRDGLTIIKYKGTQPSL